MESVLSFQFEWVWGLSSGHQACSAGAYLLSHLDDLP